MIHIPEQSENPEQHEQPELPPHPKSEPTINSAEGKKAWNEIEAELAKEAEEEDREQAEYDKGVADGSIEPEPDESEL